MSPFFMPCWNMAGAYRVCHVHQSICHTMCLAQFQKKLFQDIFIKPHILIIQCRYFSNDQTLGDIQVDMITYERYNYRKVGKRYLIIQKNQYLISYTENWCLISCVEKLYLISCTVLNHVVVTSWTKSVWCYFYISNAFAYDI